MHVIEAHQFSSVAMDSEPDLDFLECTDLELVDTSNDESHQRLVPTMSPPQIQKSSLVQENGAILWREFSPVREPEPRPHESMHSHIVPPG